METKIDERVKVETKYEDAVTSGKTAVAGYLTKSQRDMVRINIGNFPPLSSCQLRVFYYQHLKIEDLSYCLYVPMTYIPRYMGDIASYINTGV
jgi:hypothetical protein